MADENEDFKVDGVYVQDRDMDNNGIPDWQQGHANGSPENPFVTSRDAEPETRPSAFAQPGPDHPDTSADYGPDYASQAPYSRDSREGIAGVVATYDVPRESASTRKDKAETAENAAGRTIGRETDHDKNPNLADDDPYYRQAMAQMQERQLRTRPREKSRLSSEIQQAARAHRADDKDGLAIGKALLAGLQGGLAHSRKRSKEVREARDIRKADEMATELALEGAGKRREDDFQRALEAREGAARRDDAELRAVRTAELSEERAARERESHERTMGRGPNDDGPKGPDGSGPSPQGSGPSPAGPDGSGPGDGGPGSDRTVREPANDDAPGRVAAKQASTPGRGDAAVSETASGPSSAADPTEANGRNGIGAAVMAVNPAIGAVATAAQTRHAQQEAGAAHETGVRAGRAPTAIGKGPSAEKASATAERPSPQRRLATGTNRGDNVVEFRRPETRKGALHAQAAAMGPHQGRDVQSKGPRTTQPGDRVMGLGGHLVRHIEREVRGREGYDAAAAMQAAAKSRGGR